MAYQDYANEVTGWVPGIDILLAQKLVNRAWRDIRESGMWSFNVAESALTALGQLALGRVNITQFATTVIGDATASALWYPRLLSQPPLNICQFRIPNGPIYNIQSIDATNPNAIVLTLDRPYQEPSVTANQYLIYRCYYAAPVTDFLRWISVFDPINGFALKKHWTKEEFDLRDPRRGAVGVPYYIGSYKNTGTGYPFTASNQPVPMFEMWPHPTYGISYQTLFQRRGVDFVNPGDTLPPAVPEEVLMYRTQYHAYQWGAANEKVATGQQMRPWVSLWKEAQASYVVGRAKAWKQDQEAFINWINRRRVVPFLGPIDSNFAQSHESFWEAGY